MSRVTVMSFGAQLLSILAMIAFAQVSATVWALMAGMLVGSVVKCVATHLIFPGPSMRPVWDREIADRLWHYGKWLIGSSAFTFVAQNADRFILGAILNATAFGIYVIARIWIDAGRQVIAILSGNIGFPSIGEVLRERPAEVPRLFRKFQTVIDAMCVLSFLALFLLGQRLIDLLYTDIYAAAGAHLQILALGLLVMRFDPLVGLIMNVGNSRASMVISAIRAGTLCVSLPLAQNAFGMTGALYAVVLSPLVAVPYILWCLRGTLGRQLRIDAAWAVGIAVLAISYGFVTA